MANIMDDIMDNIMGDAIHPPRCTGWYEKWQLIRIAEDHVDRLTVSSSDDTLCTMCDKPGTLHCSGCTKTRYCSTSCQSEDWKFHRLLCKSLRRFSENDRPAPNIDLGHSYFRAVLFPEDKQKPQWVWVAVDAERSSVSLEVMYRGLPYLVGYDDEPRTENLTDSGHGFRAHRHGLCMILSSWDKQLHRSINQSLQKLGPPGHMHAYWGPSLVVAFKMEKGKTVGKVEDVDMDDFRYIVDSIQSLPYNPCVVDPGRYGNKHTPGVKVNAVGDRERFKLGADSIYEDVAISVKIPWGGKVPQPTTWIFSNPGRLQWPSTYAFMLGLPWICRAVISYKDFCTTVYDGDRDKLSNPELGALHATHTAAGDQFKTEFAGTNITAQPHKITKHDCPGTVILFHMYGEKIHVAHIQAFNLFVEEALGIEATAVPRPPGTVGAWKSPPTPITEEQHSKFSMKEFARFWESRKKAGGGLPGVDLENVPSPYAWFPSGFGGEGRLDGMEEEEMLFKKLLTNTTMQSVFGAI